MLASFSAKNSIPRMIAEGPRDLAHTNRDAFLHPSIARTSAVNTAIDYYREIGREKLRDYLDRTDQRF